MTKTWCFVVDRTQPLKGVAGQEKGQERYSRRRRSRVVVMVTIQEVIWSQCRPVARNDSKGIAKISQ